MPTDLNVQWILAWICGLCLIAAAAGLIALLVRLPRRFDASNAGALTLNQALDRNHLGLSKSFQQGTVWWLIAGCAAVILFWGLMSRSTLDQRNLYFTFSALMLLASVLMLNRRLRRLNEKAVASRAAIEESVLESGLLFFAWSMLGFLGLDASADDMVILPALASVLCGLLVVHARLKRFRIVCGLLCLLMLLRATASVTFASDLPAQVTLVLHWLAGILATTSLGVIVLLLRRAPRALGPRVVSWPTRRRGSPVS